jgi:hypothetical protein
MAGGVSVRIDRNFEPMKIDEGGENLPSAFIALNVG